MRRITAALAAGAIVALGTATAQAANTDYSQVARNIIPSGQQELISPIPADATAQAQMYNALTPLFDHVSNADLFSDFKSEQFGLGTDGPGTVEPVPFPGVTIVRDKFHVPHVSATTHAGGVWAAGWIAAEDRGLLLQEARDNSRVAALDVPGLTAIGLIENLQDFQPSAQTESVLSRQTRVLEKAGREGRAVLSDIDQFVIHEGAGEVKCGLAVFDVGLLADRGHGRIRRWVKGFRGRADLVLRLSEPVLRGSLGGMVGRRRFFGAVLRGSGWHRGFGGCQVMAVGLGAGSLTQRSGWE
jgi:hypothetical protein